MMGLFTFSFTLLFVGAAAYAVSLPSLMKDPEGKSFVLLDAAGHTAGSSASGMWTSLFRQMMFGEDAAGGVVREDGFWHRCWLRREHDGNLRLTRLDELAAEVNSLTEEFNRCALTTDLATRQAAAARVEKANETIWSEFSKTLNGHSIPAGSQLSDQRSRLVGSYRCLRDYLGCLDAAWSSNLDFADPSQHVNEFMEPLTETMNESGQNKYLAEYGPKRAGIVL